MPDSPVGEYEDPISFYAALARHGGLSVAADPWDYKRFDPMKESYDQQLSSIPSLHVCVKVITIHATDEQVRNAEPPVFDKGLSPVQLVLLHDDETISAMWTHWKRVHEARLDLLADEKAEETFKDLLEVDDPEFRDRSNELYYNAEFEFELVIMFRHCPDRCYTTPAFSTMPFPPPPPSWVDGS
ncbi:hypothetical protein B0I35DRAFT_437776 [Stachybotrys elegans]|uniref:Uncharacterized protein n=1 Tax=Stachybotrys elegans TaxID=80388 RepID=A0A8K0SJA7_9HYPO|nr:hypothetical protein B0I35DRAFT_437776 [Stachybotrys elegans]